MHKGQPADDLLKREPDAEYIKKWEKLLAKRQDFEGDEKALSLLLFRLKGQWMALKTSCFREILELKQAHRVPFRVNPFLLGLVNVGGQLKVAVYLDRFLRVVEEADINEIGDIVYKRMVVIHGGGATWVFPAEEVHGILHIDPAKVENVPVNILKSEENYIAGMFDWYSRNVLILDEELLLKGLRKAI